MDHDDSCIMLISSEINLTFPVHLLTPFDFPLLINASASAKRFNTAKLCEIVQTSQLQWLRTDYGDVGDAV